MGKGSARLKNTHELVKDQDDAGSVSYCKDTVHLEFMPHDQMVNKQLHQEILAQLRDAVRRNRPELWTNQTVLVYHDNAPAHTSLFIRHYIEKHQIPVVPHLPYSPDLVPAHFFLFCKLKTTLKGGRFQTTEEIQNNAAIDICAITESVFQEAFQNKKKR